MKKIFLMALVAIAIASTTAFADGDQYEVVYACTSAVLRPDAGVGVQLLKGGLAGKQTFRRSRDGYRQRQFEMCD
jgi:cytochrome c-type biogenesis protein CcmE